jgi:hypothetical protein
MEFYNYWARSKTIPVNGRKVKFAACAGFSNISQEDALRVANERAAHHAHLINTNQPLEYDYKSLPFCEEVIDRFTKDGELVTVVSRVHYGSIVLNTSNVFFADIDLPHQQKTKSSGGWIGFLFGKSTREKPPAPGTAIIENLEKVCQENDGLGFRLYRTSAGFRVMATSRTFSIDDSMTMSLLKQLRSDELYVVLCRRQRCFRARLTPKPYRIGMKQPPFRFPYRDASQIEAVKKWQSDYAEKSKNYATCALVAQIGSSRIHEDVESICQLHDHFACNGDLPLA